jgi:hypothetical protein
MVSLRKRPIASRSTSVTDETFARVVAGIKAMTKAERVQSLKNAGIVTARGDYAKPYRMLGGAAAR